MLAIGAFLGLLSNKKPPEGGLRSFRISRSLGLEYRSAAASTTITSHSIDTTI
jgi:hypothetical protein